MCRRYHAIGTILLALLLAIAAGPVDAAARTGRPAAVTFTVHGSVEEVYVLGATPAARYELLGRRDQTIATQPAGSLGGIVYRDVPPGPGYRVRAAGGGPSSSPVVVLPDRSAPPSTSIYNQTIPSSGYGYLTTRDGTKLAIDVHLPLTGGPGPYPTLVEYAGYGYADPYNGPDSGIAEIANAFGFAVVDVNMRGTGCSGGAFDYFDTLEDLDGYDVIETVAHQPWVLHHKVGMLGISYGGISQLFVAATDPPDLAAIAPLSVIDNSATTLYPGGILNTGFALQWAAERDSDAQPSSPTQGQPWAWERIQQGDLTCQANQVLHTEAVNLVNKVYANQYYVPSVADPVSPITFVNKIHVPVYLACQFTDDQTGPHCPDLAEHFTGTDHKWFTFTNGDHIDSLDPPTVDRWFDFLSLFVAHQQPKLPALLVPLEGELYNQAMGIPGISLPPDPIQSEPTYAAALSAFERLPEVRILFDNGAGGSVPFQPYASFEASFPRFPLPGTHARTWYLRPRGVLAGSPATAQGADAFTWTRNARPPTDFPANGNTGPGGLWGLSPDYDWTQNPPGTALSYITAPLKQNTVVVGAGSLRAWIKASVPDVDLQVTVSEVRPDGHETFVQNGWLRAQFRQLEPGSTLLEPVLNLSKSAAAPLPSNRWSEITVPLYYEGHAYRAGSRIRVTIEAPGGDTPIWAFADAIPSTTTTVSLAYSPTMPSRLVLPVVNGISVPTGLPPCPGLRGEPCRDYVPLVNRSADTRRRA